MGPAGAGPGAQCANHWGSPAPDLQWPCTNAPAVIRRGDGRPGTDTILSWSSDGGRTGKKFEENQCLLCSCKSTKKRISAAQNQGMGPLVSIRAFSDGYQGASVEHSLMDPPEGRRTLEEHKMHYSMCGRKLTCSHCTCDRDSSRIIIGVQARKPMSASTKRNSEKRISGAKDEGMGHWRDSGVHRAFPDRYQGASIEHSLMDP